MASWIILIVVVALFAMAVRRTRPHEPPLPDGYDRERQLAELRAMTASATRGLLP